MMDKGARFSDCGKYRYYLHRFWDLEGKGPVAMCIGLNPSTANAEKNDNTIDILCRVLKDLGYRGFYMTNLFAFISSNPDDLRSVADPLAENDYYLGVVRRFCDDVIFCWGNFKQASYRAKAMPKVFPDALCFGKSKDGNPLHPRALSYMKMLNEPKLEKF